MFSPDSNSDRGTVRMSTEVRRYLEVFYPVPQTATAVLEMPTGESKNVSSAIRTILGSRDHYQSALKEDYTLENTVGIEVSPNVNFAVQVRTNMGKPLPQVYKEFLLFVKEKFPENPYIDTLVTLVPTYEDILRRLDALPEGKRASFRYRPEDDTIEDARGQVHDAVAFDIMNTALKHLSILFVYDPRSDLEKLLNPTGVAQIQEILAQAHVKPTDMLRDCYSRAEFLWSVDIAAIRRDSTSEPSHA